MKEMTKYEKNMFVAKIILAHALLFLVIICFYEGNNSVNKAEARNYYNYDYAPEPKPKINAKRIGTRTVTAYNSVHWQTDSTPCIGAYNNNICEMYKKGLTVVATNEFPNGTKLFIKGIGMCVVADKTNSRYKYRIDLYMGDDVQKAREFGRKNLYVYEILN